jgi:hypothetical protein
MSFTLEDLFCRFKYVTKHEKVRAEDKKIDQPTNTDVSKMKLKRRIFNQKKKKNRRTRRV